MPISENEIQHLARLARLELTPHETASFSHDLASIVDYFRQLETVDTAGVTSLSAESRAGGALRADAAGSSLPRDEVLKMAPEADGEHVLVPRVIDR